MRLAALALAGCALALPACGGDEDPREDAAGTTSPTTGTETAPPAADPGAGTALRPGDRSEIESVVVAAATNREPCEHLTDRYLREFVLEGVTSRNPVQACRQAEEGQPELPPSEVKIATVRGAGDSAEVHFTIAGIQQTAMVVRSDGEWLIDKFDV